MPLVIFTVLPLKMPITSWSEATQFTFPENIPDIFSGNDTVVDSPAFAPIENNPHCFPYFVAAMKNAVPVDTPFASTICIYPVSSPVTVIK